MVSVITLATCHRNEGIAGWRSGPPVTSMHIFTPLADDLDSLSDGVHNAGPALDDTLGTLIDDIRLVVRSYLGLSMTLRHYGFPVTLTALEDRADPDDILASLRLPLTTLADVEIGSVLDLYAGQPGAFVDFAADLCHALHVPSDQVVLDEHLIPPANESTLTGAGDLSHINQAIGILISHGHTPEEARTELRRRARHNQATVAQVALRLIRETVAARLG
jgi:hypothetical protein